MFVIEKQTVTSLFMAVFRVHFKFYCIFLWTKTRIFTLVVTLFCTLVRFLHASFLL